MVLTDSREGSNGSNSVDMTDKKRRYDRGIRVWGAQGQEALEDATVCLLNCGPSGAEALKNLVLGGISSFSIVDGNKVEPCDLGNNFFVTADALGKSRAQCVTGERGSAIVPEERALDRSALG